jgi:hypothetical protein
LKSEKQSPSCGSCHEADGLGGLNLTTYDGVFAGGESGAVVQPGDPDNSLIILKQKGEQGHFGQFTSDELNIIMDWIVNGAPEQ